MRRRVADVPASGSFPSELAAFDPAEWGDGAHAVCRWWVARDRWREANPGEYAALPLDVVLAGLTDDVDVPWHPEDWDAWPPPCIDDEAAS